RNCLPVAQPHHRAERVQTDFLATGERLRRRGRLLCNQVITARSTCMTDLVLLHGGNHGSWCWGPFVQALNQQPGGFERVITLDMPGCGQKRGRDVVSLRLDDVVE